jgi:catechol 2,3-dioxygenase-like lactoylglutathione lyase family enzyme
MIDHIYLPVTDLKRSETFYGAMLGPLGKAERWRFKAQAGYPDLAGFGEPGIPGFWLKASKTTCAELYVAFAAKNEAAVNKAYEAALANGGKDNGAPGLRPQWDPRYYAANVLDPDGYNVEICYKPWLYE